MHKFGQDGLPPSALFIALVDLLRCKNLYLASGLNDVSGDTIADALGLAVVHLLQPGGFAVAGWFSAIIDIISELSETV